MRVNQRADVSDTVDNASSSLHHAIDRASDAASPVVNQLAASAHHATDRVASAANHAVGTLRGASAQLRNVPGRLTDGCSTYVQEKPMTSLGIALAGGFLLAMLLRTR
ncbi:MAG: hypothetical protein ABIN37_11235 [Burkholderiaceae bacterium]